MVCKLCCCDFNACLHILWNCGLLLASNPRQSSSSASTTTTTTANKKIHPKMERLVVRLQGNDPELLVLALTSECNAHELPLVLQALEANTTVRHVLFRESFFPLHRIRQHLTGFEFTTFLQAVGRVARDSLEINTSMKGMVRGRTIALLVSSTSTTTTTTTPSSKDSNNRNNNIDNHINNDDIASNINGSDDDNGSEAGQDDNDDDEENANDDSLIEQPSPCSSSSSTSTLRHLVAHSSLTLVDHRDVEFLSDALQDCYAVEQVTLTDCFLSRFRNNPTFLNPLLETLATRPRLKRLDLSCHGSSSSSSSTTTGSTTTGDSSRLLYSSCFTAEALDTLLSSELSRTTLEWLSLCQLALQDDHFETIAHYLRLGGRTTTTTTTTSATKTPLPDNRCLVLRHLDLNGNDPTQSGVDVVIRALENNINIGHLKHLGLKVNQFVIPSSHTLRTMITSNLTLTHLEMNPLLEEERNSHQRQQEVDFFLKLNRLGRKAILTSGNTGILTTTSVLLWNPLFREILRDPNVLYYFLKNMPGILPVVRHAS
jgi:hypothetical protein